MGKLNELAKEMRSDLEAKPQGAIFSTVGPRLEGCDAADGRAVAVGVGSGGRVSV